MKSALDYCTRLAGFPIPKFMYQSFDLSHRSSDFNHIQCQEDGFSHTAAWSSCLQMGPVDGMVLPEHVKLCGCSTANQEGEKKK